MVQVQLFWHLLKAKPPTSLGCLTKESVIKKMSNLIFFFLQCQSLLEQSNLTWDWAKISFSMSQRVFSLKEKLSMRTAFIMLAFFSSSNTRRKTKHQAMAWDRISAMSSRTKYLKIYSKAKSRRQSNGKNRQETNFRKESNYVSSKCMTNVQLHCS